MADRVRETAKEEAERVRALAEEAARSGAYWYPIKGIYYYLSHPSLQKPLLRKLAPTLTLGIGVTTFMFVFTYFPQAAVLSIVNGPLAAITTIALVLSESSTLFNFLSKTLLIDDALIDTFDGTLASENMTGLLSSGRDMKGGSDPMVKLGKLIKKPFNKLTPKAIITYFLYLPLNFIPVVGTLIFIIMQGKTYGPQAHARYFQLKSMGKHEKESWVEKHRGAYTAFGIPAVLLELIPVASVFFAFTNQVGAALWACELEKRQGTAPGLRQKAQAAGQGKDE